MPAGAKPTPKSATKPPTKSASKPAAKRSAAESRSQKPPAKRARKSETSTALKFKSPAEFFAENKNIAGFDNPGKSLYTTIRELVENGLDAAEAVNVLPDVSVHIERIRKDRFRSMVGMESRDRVDETLYKDVENDRERRVREAKEKREAKKRARGALANGEKELKAEGSQQDAAPVEKKERAGGVEIFRVTVIDNGSGMAHEDVPNMMGRVLAGTKYCVRQARGKFGLGSKMALIWSKMSTGLPVHITTAQTGQQLTTCVLDIDIARNTPTIIEHSKAPNPEAWRGTRVAVTIQGNWSTYRSKILTYMRQMAVITPYALFRFKFDYGAQNDGGKDLDVEFSRRTDKMPPLATEVKHHPSSVNQLILKQLIGDVKPSTTVVKFLTTQLDSIPRTLAVRLVKELGGDFSLSMTVKELAAGHIRQIDTLLHEARFSKANGACLSPAGEYNLRLGITKELQPTMVATHAEAAEVCEGHPFIVEVGVALGGSGMKPGINVFRFANRIPLLFEGGNDVVTKTAREGIRWGNYKISPTTQRIGVICSIVSTKVPFKGTGKEYIGEDSESIRACVKRAITQCCIQLRTKLVRRAAQKDAAEKRKLMTRYAPDVANAVIGVFAAAGKDGRMSIVDEAKDVWDQVQRGEVTKAVLCNKLVEHVKRLEKEQAIEKASVSGRDEKQLERVFLAPRSAQDAYINLVGGRAKEDGKAVKPEIETGGLSQMWLLSALQSAA